MHYYSVSGKYCFKAGSLKTNHANRVIPLSKEALTLLKNIKRNEYFNSINSGIEIDGYKNFVFLNSRKNNVIIPRACLKIHSSHLHAPLCGIFGSNSGYIARYAPFILPKAPTNCDIHLAESNFQTRSRRFGDALIAACEKYNRKEEKSAEKEKRKPELLPMITPHILRHTACTRMAEAGIDVKVLQTGMGHKRDDMTMNIYNHVDLCRIQKEFEKVDSLEKECILM